MVQSEIEHIFVNVIKVKFLYIKQMPPILYMKFGVVRKILNEIFSFSSYFVTNLLKSFNLLW